MTQLQSADTAVLILTHVFNPGVRSLCNELRRECAGHYDLFFVCDNTKSLFTKYANDGQFFLFSIEQLNGLSYPNKTNVGYSDAPSDRTGYHKGRNFTVGNTELPILLFFHEHRTYRYYWIIEYDVRYTGSWRDLLDCFSDSGADLLTTSLSKFVDVERWNRWRSIEIGDLKAERDAYLRGFLPIYRISNRALAMLDRAYLAGASGHYEGLLPTLVSISGMAVEDIGGKGKFVKPENHNRFYTNNETSDSLAPGTFVFSPRRHRPGKKRNTLWHPVKYRPPWVVLLITLRAAARSTWRTARAGIFGKGRIAAKPIADRLRPSLDS